VQVSKSSTSILPTIELGQLIALIVLFVVALAPLDVGAKDLDSQIRQATEHISSSILRDIFVQNRKTRIAVRPFRENELGLPQSVANRLYHEFLNSLRNNANYDFDIIQRHQLNKIYGTLDEFHGTNIDVLLEMAQADYEIVCEMAPVQVGIEFSCTATNLSDLVTAYAKARLSDSILRRQPQLLSNAIVDISNHLFLFIKGATGLNRMGFIDQNSGRLDDLGAFIEGQLIENLSARIEEQSRTERRRFKFLEGIKGDRNKFVKNSRVYQLAGKYWNFDERELALDVALRLDGNLVTTKQVVVKWNSIPKKFHRRETRSHQFFESIGTAIVSRGFNRVAALRGARNLARARVIRLALGLEAPIISMVRNGSDAVDLLKDFSFGITFDERFEVRQSTGPQDQVGVSLKAKVAAVSRGGAPRLSASLNKELFRSHEPMRISISSATLSQIGLFAWFANNRVVRIYPNNSVPDVTIAKNGQLNLPYQNTEIRSVPLPGNVSDFESLIVIANSEPENFESLAPLPGATVDKSIKRSVLAHDFLLELSNLNLSKTRVIFLPYQVRD
jgi:hypothetical protein